MRRLTLLTLALLLLGSAAHHTPCGAQGICKAGACFGNDCGSGCVCVIPPGKFTGQCYGVR